jgi:hypothetical protein
VRCPLGVREPRATSSTYAEAGFLLPNGEKESS